MPEINEPQFRTDYSFTNYDGMLEDVYCNYKREDGMVCNAWLGYGYPSNRCPRHPYH